MRYGWIALFLLSGLVAFSQNSARVKQLENQRKKALEETLFVSFSFSFYNKTTTTKGDFLFLLY